MIVNPSPPGLFIPPSVTGAAEMPLMTDNELSDVEEGFGQEEGSGDEEWNYEVSLNNKGVDNILLYSFILYSQMMVLFN